MSPSEGSEKAPAKWHFMLSGSKTGGHIPDTSAVRAAHCDVSRRLLTPPARTDVTSYSGNSCSEAASVAGAGEIVTPSHQRGAQRGSIRDRFINAGLPCGTDLALHAASRSRMSVSTVWHLAFCGSSLCRSCILAPDAVSAESCSAPGGESCGACLSRRIRPMRSNAALDSASLRTAAQNRDSASHSLPSASSLGKPASLGGRAAPFTH